ncbi:hypothetical protein G4V62_07210 [Bacillaceae bacterium SIJ1]|uniref:hypothetical protein n=1 Tax=Litoribacterium kuwaitense TaxID=1398745 RepID=UPI0013EB30B5|nr:hypothetical protein [Litoribacterium kuwaitense]NGP44754.1 hypothetical protein [Litoribacterium kuwaitense]
MKQHKIKLFRHIIVALCCLPIAFFIVLITPILKKQSFGSNEELASAAFGFPFPFLHQEVMILPPPNYFPFEAAMYNPLTYETSIHVGPFVASIVVGAIILFITLELPYWAWRGLRIIWQKKAARSQLRFKKAVKGWFKNNDSSGSQNKKHIDA